MGVFTHKNRTCENEAGVGVPPAAALGPHVLQLSVSQCSARRISSSCSWAGSAWLPLLGAIGAPSISAPFSRTDRMAHFHFEMFGPGVSLLRL